MRPWIIERKVGESWQLFRVATFYRAHLAQSCAIGLNSGVLRVRNTLTNEVRDV